MLVFTPFALVLIPLYVAFFLAFTQDIEDWVIYGSFGIIYGPYFIVSIFIFGTVSFV